MRPGLHISRVLSALAVLAALALAVLEAPQVALLLGPAFLLLLILVVGVFPGEEAIARARARRSRARRTRAPVRVAPPALPDVARPAGAALAFALAMRPPPAAAVCR
ncbi:hypothetical protein [Patulibacter sp.]|uniref:hypothetical protein n=1 Tax=Patulibacter sp. TaxID=1912859 RepID=UPI0027250FE5|nr:hypothetical protein [Patulibacter sp.]MDO9406965.1 hypothetical protein [Patulibacter sp.]